MRVIFICSRGAHIASSFEKQLHKVGLHFEAVHIAPIAPPALLYNKIRWIYLADAVVTMDKTSERCAKQAELVFFPVTYPGRIETADLSSELKKCYTYLKVKGI